MSTCFINPNKDYFLPACAHFRRAQTHVLLYKSKLKLLVNVCTKCGGGRGDGGGGGCGGGDTV